MGLKISFYSGGKESFYSSMLEWPIDIFLVLIYDFPRPSPHLINLHAVIYSAVLTGKPVYTVKLTKGKEFIQTVNVLKELDADIIVAGDVFIEDHLKYMEKLASESGAKLKEPLWSMDARDLLYKEVEYGIKFIITGISEKIPKKWLCKYIDINNIDNFLSESIKFNFDPIGEYGEYHTQVVKAPKLSKELKCKCIKKYNFDNYLISMLEVLI